MHALSLTYRILRSAALVALTPMALAAQAQAPVTPLTLGDAARLAAERGATAIAARERAMQSGARVIAARASLLPSLTSETIMDGGSETSAGIGGAPAGAPPLAADRDVNMRLSVTQPVLDLASLRRWRATAKDADGAAETARHEADAAAERGALAYLGVLRAEAQLSARRADSALAAELLDIARQQLQAGTAIALDVTRAESQLASTVSQLIAARSDAARTRLELLHVLALPLATQLVLADSLTAPAPGDVTVTEDDAVRHALNRRGDLLAAGAAAEAARREVGAVKAERLPVVSLFSTASSNSEGLLDSRSYGLQVSVPLFDGFRREARVAEGRAREREAIARQDDLRLRIEVDVRSALLDLDAARERVTAADVQLRLAEQEVAQARERFSAGVAGNADVIQASLTLNGVRDIVVDALTAYHQARISLASAQGATTTLH